MKIALIGSDASTISKKLVEGEIGNKDTVHFFIAKDINLDSQDFLDAVEFLDKRKTFFVYVDNDAFFEKNGSDVCFNGKIYHGYDKVIGGWQDEEIK